MSTFQNKNAGSNSEFAVFIELIKDLKNTILMLQEMIKNQNAKLCEYEERDKKKLAASSSTLEKRIGEQTGRDFEINFETESLTFENSNKQGELFRAKMYGNGNGNQSTSTSASTSASASASAAASSVNEIKKSKFFSKGGDHDDEVDCESDQEPANDHPNYPESEEMINKSNKANRKGKIYSKTSHNFKPYIERQNLAGYKKDPKTYKAQNIQQKTCSNDLPLLASALAPVPDITSASLSASTPCTGTGSISTSTAKTSNLKPQTSNQPNLKQAKPVNKLNPPVYVPTFVPPPINLNPTNTKKKRAKKRKASMPIGGSSYKKVIESASSENSRENTDEEMSILDEDVEMQWESEHMLKDNRWSLSKGLKKPSDLNSLTPIIIRHDNAAKNLSNYEIPLLDLSDGEIEDDDITEAQTTPPFSNQSDSTLKSSITVECPRMNKSTYRGTINYTEAKDKIHCKQKFLS